MVEYKVLYKSMYILQPRKTKNFQMFVSKMKREQKTKEYENNDKKLGKL